MLERLRTTLRRFVGESATQRVVVLSGLVDSVGTGLFLAVATLFVTGQVGLSAAQLGLGLSIAGVLGLLVGVPVGVLGDRFSAKKVLVGLHLWTAAGFLAYVFVDGFLSFLLVVCLIVAAERSMPPLTQSLVADVVEPEERVRTMARLRAVRNAGFGLGALLATIPLALDTRIAYNALFVFNGLSFMATALMLARVRRNATDASRPEEQPPVSPRGSAERKVLSNRSFVALTVLSAVLLLDESILAIGIPLWLDRFTEAPKALVGVLFVANTIMVVLLQVRISDAAKTSVAAAWAMRSAGILLAATTLVLAVASGLPPIGAVAALIFAIIVLTLGEMLLSAGSWQLSYAMAPSSARSKYLSVFGLASTGQKIVGPLVITALVIPFGSVGWVCLGGVLALVGVLAGHIGRPLREKED